MRHTRCPKLAELTLIRTHTDSELTTGILLFKYDHLCYTRELALEKWYGGKRYGKTTTPYECIRTYALTPKVKSNFGEFLGIVNPPSKYTVAGFHCSLPNANGVITPCMSFGPCYSTVGIREAYEKLMAIYTENKGYLRLQVLEMFNQIPGTIRV